AVLLPVIGLVFYARSIAGVRSYWPFGVGLLGYNALLLLGFLNFQIAMGLAFIAAAVWHSGRKDRPWRTASIVAVLAIAVFFSHIMGLVFLAILLCADEVADPGIWRDPRHLFRRVAAVALVFVIPALLYFWSDLAGDSGPAIWVGWSDKLAILFQPFLN